MKRYDRTNRGADFAPATTPAREAPEYRWADLLVDAVNTPGTISKCYSIFWSYSLGNQLAALSQCQARGLQPGPSATYPGWAALGRHVRKGEKALTLCQPVTRCRAA